MKNKSNPIARNLQMNTDTYTLRCQVMAYVYEAKLLLRSEGITMKRVDVRITEQTREFLGLAKLNDCIIWMPINVLQSDRYKPYLREIVFHELVHALTGFKHSQKCDLMKAGLYSSILDPLPKVRAEKLFLKYFAK
jgi:hypothetical protein